MIKAISFAPVTSRKILNNTMLSSFGFSPRIQDKKKNPRKRPQVRNPAVTFADLTLRARAEAKRAADTVYNATAGTRSKPYAARFGGRNVSTIAWLAVK